MLFPWQIHCFSGHFCSTFSLPIDATSAAEVEVEVEAEIGFVRTQSHRVFHVERFETIASVSNSPVAEEAEVVAPATSAAEVAA